MEKVGIGSENEDVGIVRKEIVIPDSQDDPDIEDEIISDRSCNSISTRVQQRHQLDQSRYRQKTFVPILVAPVESRGC